MNKAQKTTTMSKATDFETVSAALAPVQADFVKSYAAALKKECTAAREFMDSFDLRNAGTYAAEPYYKAQRKWWALTGKNYTAMAEAAWMKRLDTLIKGIKRNGVDIMQINTIQAVPQAADFWMFLKDRHGNSCHARAVLVLGTEKRPHMRFICT